MGKHNQQTPERLALLEFDMGWSLWLTKAQVPFQIGRHPENDLRNNSSYVSRHHCIIDYQNEKLLFTDQSSNNGSIVQNQHLRNQSCILDKRVCVLLSDMIFWISPCDGDGHLIQELPAESYSVSPGKEVRGTQTKNEQEGKHGICLVDICDSVEIGIKQVESITQAIRNCILKRDHRNILLLKNTGDGYLIVYDAFLAAVHATERLLRWQSSRHNTFSTDIRISLDVGTTYPSHGHDRMGLAIYRASRFEKSQRRDFEVEGADLEKLRSRNRCLLSDGARKNLNAVDDKRWHCSHIGARKLRGFSNILHDLYQYTLCVDEPP